VSGRPDGLARLHEQNLKLLRTCTWLADLPDDSRERLARAGVRRVHRDGTVLFRVGDRCESIWLICAGKVEAVARSLAGREFVVHVAGPGETPGHLDVIDLGVRTIDARVVGEAETLSMPAAAVRNELLGNPTALMRLTADLVAMNRTLAAAVTDQVLLGLDARIAKLLLSHRGVDGAVDLSLSQSALAAQLGVARQSLNRALGAMARRGLIDVAAGGRRIRVLDERELTALALGDDRAAGPV
jgi:CRP-like cAMP-binding protein